jgi:hypothetical protein
MTLLLSYLDENMIRGALTPLPERQHWAVMWLTDHYLIFADQSPKDGDSHLSVSSKFKVWESYQKECLNIDVDYVEYSKFIELWNGINRLLLLRPYMNIPGKFSTSYEIESVKNNCKDKAILEAIKQVHHLHSVALRTYNRTYSLPARTVFLQHHILYLISRL